MNTLNYYTGPVASRARQIMALQNFKKDRSFYFDLLTEREKEIFILVARGLSNPEIAGRLGIARATVQNHRAIIRQKLVIRHETDYFKYALAFDLIVF